MYFDNPDGKQCFRSALSNLLVCFGERKLACESYRAYPNHPLVSEFVNMGIVTKLVRDLTNRKYLGILQTPKFDFDFEEFARKNYSRDLSGEIIKHTNFEIESGNVQFVDEVNLFSENYIYLKIGSPMNHWIVARSDGLDVNDGRIEEPNPSINLGAVLQIYSFT